MLDKLNIEDVIQVIIGSAALSVPIAFSEELWNLSMSLPILNIIFILLLSLAFINLYVIQGIFQGNIQYRIKIVIVRTIFDYFITLLVVAIVLFALNKLPLLTDTIIAIKRLIILSFPAAMGGVVIDGLDKE